MTIRIKGVDYNYDQNRRNNIELISSLSHQFRSSEASKNKSLAQRKRYLNQSYIAISDN